jgi:hypothetical protein
MGFLSSTKLKCPRGYDNNKFALIRQLFHQLDENGDRALSFGDLKQISEPYFYYEVKNRYSDIERLKDEETETITKLEEDTLDKIESDSNKYKRKNKDNYLTKKQKESLISIELKNQKKINNIQRDYGIAVATKKLEIKLIKKYNKHDKLLRFMEDLRGKSKDGTEVEFKHFFKLLKDRNVKGIIDKMEVE